MKLLIDIGNTSAKIAIGNADEIIYTEHLEQSWTEAIERLLQQYPIQHAVISDVAAKSAEPISIIQKRGIPIVQICDTTECALKSIPKGYGADRIAADLGALAKHKGRTILVVDAGTCITYDLIDREGNVLGGCISAGVSLRLKAMHEHTAALPLLEADADTPLLGYDTRTHMMSSAIHGTQFELEGYVRSFAKAYPDLVVCTTGGNDLEPTEPLPAEVEHAPLLLFRGLNTL